MVGPGTHRCLQVFAVLCIVFYLALSTQQEGIKRERKRKKKKEKNGRSVRTI
jgi:hypothetical protein